MTDITISPEAIDSIEINEEAYLEAAKQIVDEANTPGNNFWIQFKEDSDYIGQPSSIHEPNFVVAPKEEGELHKHFTVGEFICGTMVWFLDQSLPNWARGQQLFVLSRAVRIEIENREMRVFLSALESNKKSLEGEING